MVLAFIFRRWDQATPSAYNHARFLTTVDEIEGLTGIDFLMSLPDQVEAQLEPQALAAWPTSPADFIRACQGSSD